MGKQWRKAMQETFFNKNKKIDKHLVRLTNRKIQITNISNETG